MVQEQGIHCAGSDLCQELNGSVETTFALTYEGDPASRRIAESESLVLIADLSPLVVGHLLLLPISHYLSFAGVCKDHSEELARLLDSVVPKYRKAFGSPVMLEHGSSSDMNGSACITHAHWHLIPIEGIRVSDIMERDGLEPINLKGHEQLAEYATVDRPYYYCSYGTVHTLYFPRRRMRSQYLRSVSGEVLGIDEPLWDYSLVVRKDYLRETMRLVADWTEVPPQRAGRASDSEKSERAAE